MRPRKPGAKHDRVDKLREQAEQEYNKLFYTDEKLQRQPRYALPIMKEKEAELVAKFDAAMAAIMDEAAKAHTEAEAILAKVDNPYQWLNDTELQRASTLAPFIKEDIAAMDAARLVEAIKTAAAGDKVTRWLIHRYAEGQYRELDKDLATALGMAGKANYSTAQDALRDSLIPADRQKERAAAQSKLDEALALHDAAEWARPSVRAETAARWNVPVESLP